jgi:phospholipid-binding lipoprotein MlaA
MAVPPSSCRRRVAFLALCTVSVLAVALLLAAPAQSAGDDERPLLPGLHFATSLDRAADAAVPDSASADSAAPVFATPESPADSPPLSERIGDTLTKAVDGAGAAMRPLVDKAGELAGRVSAPSLEDGTALASDLATRVQHGVLEPIWETYAAGPGEDAEEDERLPAVLAAAPPAMRDALRAQYDEALRNAIDADDPLEEFNRVMFGLNDRLRQNILYPVTSFYLRVTTPPFQQGVRNFFANLREPVSIASSLLEGQFADAGIATARFGINSTAGIVGVLDPATRMGLPKNPRDVEEAFCLYGLPSGPYLVLPILGPGTLRDAAGRLSTLIAYSQAMGSTVYIAYRLTDIAVRSIDVQKQLDRLNASSLDPYVAQRVFVLSTRALDCGRQAQVSSEYFHK